MEVWAEILEFLIGNGHPSAIEYSPRQAAAFYELAVRRVMQSLQFQAAASINPMQIMSAIDG
jgi:hypothetical protein